MTVASEWPDGALPIRIAVFRQPMTDELKEVLSEMLLPSRMRPTPLGRDIDGSPVDFGGLLGGKYISEPTFLDTLLATFKGVHIDYEAGAFVYSWEWRDFSGTPKSRGLFGSRKPDRTVTYSIQPYRFDLDSYADFTPPKDISGEAKEELTTNAKIVWTGLRAMFANRIRHGDVSLHARARSPLAPPQPIAPDSWTHFQVSDWWDGVATCDATGEGLFSVHAIEREGVGASDAGIENFAGGAEGDDGVVRYLAWFERQKAETGIPPSAKEGDLWGQKNGVVRSDCREARRRIDESEKLGFGGKRAVKNAKRTPSA